MSKPFGKSPLEHMTSKDECAKWQRKFNQVVEDTIKLWNKHRMDEATLIDLLAYLQCIYGVRLRVPTYHQWAEWTGTQPMT